MAPRYPIWAPRREHNEPMVGMGVTKDEPKETLTLRRAFILNIKHQEGSAGGGQVGRSALEVVSPEQSRLRCLPTRRTSGKVCSNQSTLLNDCSGACHQAGTRQLRGGRQRGPYQALDLILTSHPSEGEPTYRRGAGHLSPPPPARGACMRPE